MPIPKTHATSSINATQKALAELSLRDTASTVASSIHDRLKQSGYDDNDINIIEKMITNNPKYKNRLIALFENIKTKNIDLNQIPLDALAKNATRASPYSNLIDFIYSKSNEFNLKEIEFIHLFDAAEYEENVLNGLNDLLENGLLSSETLNLVLTYPKDASTLTQLIINLNKNEYEYSLKPLEDKLGHCSKEYAGAVFDLLNFACEQTLFYPDLIDNILKQEQYADAILEGAKKLAGGKALSPFYFDLVRENPSNAISFAKNIRLLSGASLIDLQDKNSLKEVSQLGNGEFLFFKLLRGSDSLNAQTYEMVRCNHWLFAQDDVKAALDNIPLFDSFNKHELYDLLNILNKRNPSPADVNRFITIINDHHLIDSEQKAPSLSNRTI